MPSEHNEHAIHTKIRKGRFGPPTHVMACFISQENEGKWEAEVTMQPLDKVGMVVTSDADLQEHKFQLPSGPLSSVKQQAFQTARECVASWLNCQPNKLWIETEVDWQKLT